MHVRGERPVSRCSKHECCVAAATSAIPRVNSESHEALLDHKSPRYSGVAVDSFVHCTDLSLVGRGSTEYGRHGQVTNLHVSREAFPILSALNRSMALRTYEILLW